MINKSSFLYILHINWTMILINIDRDIRSRFWNYIGFIASIGTINLTNYLIGKIYSNNYIDPKKYVISKDVTPRATKRYSLNYIYFCVSFESCNKVDSARFR